MRYEDRVMLAQDREQCPTLLKKTALEDDNEDERHKSIASGDYNENATNCFLATNRKSNGGKNIRVDLCKIRQHTLKRKNSLWSSWCFSLITHARRRYRQ